MLIALTVVLTIVVVLNLVLTFALLRRVVGAESRLATIERGAPTMAEVGERIEEFTAATTTGEILTRDELTPGTVIGFFDPDCELCQSHVAGFSATAAAIGDRTRTLAVIREAEEADLMAQAFGPGVRTVIEKRRGPVARAFHVHATPSFCTVGPGQTIASHDYQQPALV
ncbi:MULTISPECIES: hypothetical protein [Dactylosporangium]|uniref:Thioredoxin domain-containing protein n=2 Tax=Dactylosporangium TaxID=35753 RepID=A0A9W6KPF8_9ACTN|nr:MULTISPECIES: hypothetical protein [Dactylosporangium]UAC01163.1 hypothetical protein Dvina_25810 [Dactylosporangium vinaceum]UWZ48722.1 hypothetical protein Dmats_21350 [Dactylosporangium matsuzakiense]GLL03099.1 hypothetical protein GCM10017581_048420 [Dactylosporangium matsuzakiense]